MNITRRQFIKFTSLAGTALWMGLPGCAHVFNLIPTNEQNYIPVTGIFPNPKSIKESGIHLRWALPPSKGIPNSLTIYRKLGSPKTSNIFIRPADSKKETLPSNIEQIALTGPLDNFHLSETNYGKCYEVNQMNSNDHLRITFSSGIDFCNIQLGVINPLTAKSYYQDNSLSQSIKIENISTYKTISFQSSNGRLIKYIEIPINFKYLYFIEFNGKQYLCDSKDWEEIDEINNENDIDDQRLHKRISSETKNYYLKERSRFNKI